MIYKRFLKVILITLILTTFSSCMYTVTKLPNGCKYYHRKSHSDRYRHYSIKGM